jgi:hypothetical protein
MSFAPMVSVTSQGVAVGAQVLRGAVDLGAG